MRKTHFRSIISSPWWILVFLGIAWGPVFVADFVRVAYPRLDASYEPQTFAINWLPILSVCTSAALTLFLLHGVRFLVFVVRRARGSISSDDTQLSHVTDKLVAVVFTGFWLTILFLAGFGIWAIFPRGRAVETWLIPDGYVGWLRLDYSIAGAPPLPFAKRHYVVRIPQSGRLQTSTTNKPPVDDNEYFPSGSSDRIKNLVLTMGSNPQYGIQVDFSFGKGKSDTPEAECIFVGTYAQFKSNHRDCMAWKPGQSEPPESNKRAVASEAN